MLLKELKRYNKNINWFTGHGQLSYREGRGRFYRENRGFNKHRHLSIDVSKRTVTRNTN